MIDEDLLKKWLNDDLTDAEKIAIIEQTDYTVNQKIIDSAQHFKASNFSRAEDFETFKTNYQKKSSVKRINWIRPLLRIASVLVIGLAIYFSFFNNNLVNEKTLASEKSTISLPDLSKVTLNADSKITYDANSWDSTRRLKLEGEAYFKVAKGETFDVVTKTGVVTVVGTEFNVKERDNYFEVKCYEGIVKVTVDSIKKQLLAGDTFRILNNKLSQDKMQQVQPQWINNISRFKAIPLADVADELERQYNIEVKFNNTDSKRLFSGGFVHNNLNNALMSITQPMDLTFKISSSNQVLINGSKN